MTGLRFSSFPSWSSQRGLSDTGYQKQSWQPTSKKMGNSKNQFSSVFTQKHADPIRIDVLASCFSSIPFQKENSHFRQQHRFCMKSRKISKWHIGWQQPAAAGTLLTRAACPRNSLVLSIESRFLNDNTGNSIKTHFISLKQLQIANLPLSPSLVLLLRIEQSTKTRTDTLGGEEGGASPTTVHHNLFTRPRFEHPQQGPPPKVS